VLSEDPGVFDGHLPPTEVSHLGSTSKMPRVQRSCTEVLRHEGTVLQAQKPMSGYPLHS
jgi:hypothetical protein